MTLETATIDHVRRPFKKLAGSRQSLFEQLARRPALRPLPERPYAYASWKQVTVKIDSEIT